jgi:glycosyltransferase involved in cell wall biosynthesis
MNIASDHAGLKPAEPEISGMVSTIITSFNKAPWLAEAIESALSQDYANQEVIVVDDGSSDATREVCSAFGEQIKFIYQENQGCPAAKNTGIFAARGEFIAILDGDDRWRPGKLTKQVALLRKNTVAGLVYSDRLKFNMDRVTMASNWQKHTPRRGWVLDQLLTDNFIPVSTVVARRRCLYDAGLFNPAQRIASDYDLWLRFSRKFQVDYVDEVLMEYRTGIDSIGSRCAHKFDQLMTIQSRFVNEYYGGSYPRPKVIAVATANRLESLGDFQLAQGQQLAAINTYMRACRLDPTRLSRYRSILRGLVPGPLAKAARLLVGKRATPARS